MPWFRKKKGKIEPVRESERVARTEDVLECNSSNLDACIRSLPFPVL